MPESRLNLGLLRGRQAAAQPVRGRDLPPGLLGRSLSRREVLHAGAVLGAASSFLGTLPTLSSSFRLAQDGRRVLFMLGDKVSWEIDPDRFAGHPRLRVDASPQSVLVHLVGARLPGTRLPADLTCLCKLTALGWWVRLSLTAGGFAAQGSLEPWLAGEETLRSPVEFATPLVKLRDGHAAIRCDGGLALFRPDWRLVISPASNSQLLLAQRSLGVEGLELALPAQTEMRMAARPQPKWTRSVLTRGQADWRPVTEVAPPEGTQISINPSALNVLTLELEEGVHGKRIFFHAASEKDEIAGHTRPGELYQTPGGDVLDLSLRDVRVAGAIEQGHSELALTASLSTEPIWLQAGGSRLQLTDLSGEAALEMLAFQDELVSFRLTPALAASASPLPGVIATAAPPGRPTRVALVKAPVTSSVGGLCATVLPEAGRKTLDLCLPEPCLQVLRPDDLLWLRFEFRNLHLRHRLFRERYLERTGGRSVRFVSNDYPTVLRAFIVATRISARVRRRPARRKERSERRRRLALVATERSGTMPAARSSGT